jgi:hypothetical protein
MKLWEYQSFVPAFAVELNPKDYFIWLVLGDSSAWKINKNEIKWKNFISLKDVPFPVREFLKREGKEAKE